MFLQKGISYRVEPPITALKCSVGFRSSALSFRHKPSGARVRLHQRSRKRHENSFPKE
jgi:hypothetical protein